MSRTRTAHAAGEITRFGVLPATVSLQIREPGSALTHFSGFILVLVGAGPLLLRARESGSGIQTAAMLVFLVSAAVLYAASTLYHTVVTDEEKTTLFRKADHMSISLLIAGTYTPVCLLALPGRAGRWLLGAIWFLAAAGILIKAFWITCPKWFSSVLYILMGWLCVFAFGPLLAVLPRGAFAWLLAGGISYSLGAVIYALHLREFDRRHPYFGTHEIFHVLIMAGTFCHYLVMFRYLVFFPV